MQSVSGRIQQSLYNFQRRFASRAVILMYHRIADVAVDPWGLCVTPRHFIEQLEVMRRYAHPLSLRQLVQAQREGKIPPHAVVVTFDDGYADNLHQARPLLEHANVPATVFLTSGQIGETSEFWWDELDRLLLQPGALPAQLCLRLEGQEYCWNLGPAIYYSPAEIQRDRGCRLWEAEPGSRLAFYYSIWQRLQPLPHASQCRVLDQIAAWLVDSPAPRPSHRALTSNEVRLLAQGSLIEIGAHTVTHPLLPAHSIAIQRAEIVGSKAAVEAIIGRPVMSFSYPFGEYAPETLALIRQAGFASACSVSGGVVWQESDRWQLPRHEVLDADGDAFAKRLLGWFRN